MPLNDEPYFPDTKTSLCIEWAKLCVLVCFRDRPAGFSQPAHVRQRVAKQWKKWNALEKRIINNTLGFAFLNQNLNDLFIGKGDIVTITDPNAKPDARGRVHPIKFSKYILQNPSKAVINNSERFQQLVAAAKRNGYDLAYEDLTVGDFSKRKEREENGKEKTVPHRAWINVTFRKKAKAITEAKVVAFERPPAFEQPVISGPAGEFLFSRPTVLPSTRPDPRERICPQF